AGGTANWNPVHGSCADVPWGALTGGDGGNGVTGDAYTSNCSITPGSGGGWTYDGSDWGGATNGSDGSAVVGAETQLPTNLSLQGSAIGSTMTLTCNQVQPLSLNFVFLSFQIAPPIKFKKTNLWFLEAPVFLIGSVQADANGSFVLSAGIPN